MTVNASDCTLLSSVHGRDRRSLRSIGRRDLQAAVLYGVKERTYSPSPYEYRWKYTFANVVYITDSTSRHEVTSYVLPCPIDKVKVSFSDEQMHQTLCERLSKKPDSCTSHMILVVDQSGSMRTCDVENYKTRSDAVYGTLALDLIGRHIDSNMASPTDVLTLIEMRSKATVVFDREPVTNVMYNKMVEQQRRALPSDHGHYLPALSMATCKMQEHAGEGACPLHLMFLSDGRPSDYLYTGDAQNMILSAVESMARKFGKQLTAVMVGFGAKDADFSMLQRMSEAATSGGANGVFLHSQLCPDTLASTMTQFRTGLTATVTALRARSTYTPKSIEREEWKLASESSIGGELAGDGWNVYVGEGVRRAKWSRKGHEWSYQKLASKGATGIAIRKKAFGEGAERIVFQMQEVAPGKNGHLQFVGQRLVGKESRHVEDDELKLGFHETFFRTQMQAKKFANRFNKAVSRALRDCESDCVARIEFLECWIYEFPDHIDKSYLRGVLSEELLDLTNDGFCKWNSNSGYVHGMSQHRSSVGIDFPHFHGKEVDVDADAAVANGWKPTKHTKLSKPAETLRTASLSDLLGTEESDEEDLPPDEDLQPKRSVRFANCESDEEASSEEARSVHVDRVKEVELHHFPQAFSHYSYWISHRKRLVCDLQGVLDRSSCPPVFRLTDPAIHFKSGRERKNVFGRSDQGPRGIDDFFRSHICNKLCHLLHLPSDHGT